MVTLYHLPTFHSLFSHKFSFSSSHFPLPNFSINDLHKCRHSTIVASSIKKSTRASRKVRSDADLYNDIRDLLSTAGLPENHVPTMKELSQFGRQDLANVVRRRGYKFIRQLLTTSYTSHVIGSDIDTGQTGNLEDYRGPNEKQKVSTDVSSNGSIQVEDLRICIKPDENLKSEDENYVATESITLSLQKKVARFIRHGELDTIEDKGLEITNEELVGEHGRIVKSEDSHKTQTSIDGGKDLNAKKVENQIETRRLKLLLHQKELELTQLKALIEKEKLAFSLLQTKAETEISTAHKLISQKDTELRAAEETLSGLKEVEINYSGDGDTVELAGSFNGWDHNIRMDLQPSSSVADPTGSRTCRIWQAVLWLYPGVYEIKFIIDGHWEVDPLRESISWNGVQNNILRVDK